ncbi:MAG: hypothetical protein SVX43_00530 [Cyanobacteriota bacterium]|nr:hypothetical protein [Cyanobacteriota bacterium]
MSNSQYEQAIALFGIAFQVLHDLPQNFQLKLSKVLEERGRDRSKVSTYSLNFCTGSGSGKIAVRLAAVGFIRHVLSSCN